MCRRCSSYPLEFFILVVSFSIGSTVAEVCTANSLPYVVYCSWPDYCCGHKCCSHDMTIIKVIVLLIFALILLKTWSYFSNRKADERTSLVSVIDVPMREVPPPPSEVKAEDPPPPYDLAMLLSVSREPAPVSYPPRQNLDTS
ncbi:uncharacterized protein [Anabrus simplex]|uniref:uncharacterized protein n=1 Tax=Anabrus simplex TaxID=316456 RepID=UPI0035A34329